VKLLTTKQAAEKLAMSVWTLRSLVKAGLIPCVKINQRLFRFRDDALDKWAQRKEAA
jgi:excisionase family DNA binding protein